MHLTYKKPWPDASGEFDTMAKRCIRQSETTVRPRALGGSEAKAIAHESDLKSWSKATAESDALSDLGVYVNFGCHNREAMFEFKGIGFSLEVEGQ